MEKKQKQEPQIESITVIDAVTIGLTPEYYIKHNHMKGGEKIELAYDQTKPFVEVHVESKIVFIPLTNIKFMVFKK